MSRRTEKQSEKEDLSFLSKPVTEMTPIERLKYSQHIFRKKWKSMGGGGISTEYTGRPGTSTLCNKQRCFPKTEKQIGEELRMVLLHKILSILSSIEQEIPLLMDSNNSTIE